MSRPHSVGVNLTPDVKTTIFTVPLRNISSWSLLYAFNGTASAKNFRAYWYDSSEDMEIPVIFDYPLASKTFLKFDGASVILDEQDEIRVWIETGATNATCIITVDCEQRSAVQHFL